MIFSRCQTGWICVDSIGEQPWPWEAPNVVRERVGGQHKRVTPILNNVPYDAIVPLRGGKAIDLNDFDRFLSELDKRIRKEEK